MLEQDTCSALSIAAGEPLLGSAPQVGAWLMIESPGAWSAKPLNDLDAMLARWLDDALAALTSRYGSARPQLIRRRESTSGGTITVMLGLEDELLRAEFDNLAALVAAPLDERAFRREERPQYFMCTNGRRDGCCSKFGLPALRVLRDTVGDRAWQTTHTGGHRFAPNVLVLPGAAMYGRVLEADAAQFAAEIEQGRTPVAYLRGHTSLPPVAQVARTQLDRAGPLIHHDATSATFATEAGEHRVEVLRSKEPVTVLASCGDEQLKTVYPLVLPGEPGADGAPR